jgi:recombination protein RecR
MDSQLEKLQNYFKTFPGIGRRQAERFVYHILAQDNNWTDSFIREIKNARANVNECKTCFRIFKNTGVPECDVCTSKLRNRKMLGVVEKANDAEILLSNSFFTGLIFVLGGNIPVIQKKVQRQVRANELMNYIKKISAENSKSNKKDGFSDFDLALAEDPDLEVIFCTSLNPDGVFTATLLSDEIRKLELQNVKVTTLGRGFSTGTEFEYADKDTLRYAFENRSSNLI